MLLGKKVKKMHEIAAVGLILALLMTKKNPPRRFGQMTLGGDGEAKRALEYLKSDPKGITRQVNRVEWMNKRHAAAIGWLLPPWVLPATDEDRAQFRSADGVQDVAIIHDVDPAQMPLLVHQASALRGLDALLAEVQEDGAMVEDDGKRLLLDMGDGFVAVSFIRNTKAGKFAPFIVRRHQD